VFDINDPSTSEVKPNSPLERQLNNGGENPGVDTGDDLNPLDQQPAIERWTMLLSYYRQELERQGPNRCQQALDAAYYDGDQWTDEEIQILNERGQTPIVYNVIATTCNWVIGSEKRGRTDFKILPRNADDAKPAECKTKFLKYLADVNRDPFHRSRAFEDTIKVGIGWIERGAQDADDEEMIYMRTESWRNMLWDSADQSIDGKGQRYQFRSRWVDYDIAAALFPDRKDVIEQSCTGANAAGSYDLLDGDIAMDQAEYERDNTIGTSANKLHRRKRVRLIEAWYRMPQMMEKLSGGMFNNEIYDDSNENHKAEVASGRARINRKLGMRVRVAVLTTTALLYDGESPYKHNRFPFTPVWGYKRDDNGLPYGMIRQLRSIQDDINKRASKALAILSSNKTIMDEDALAEGWTLDDYADEVAKPNAIILKRTGKEIKMDVDRDLAPAHLELMTRNIGMVQQVGGVTDEQMGRHTNATSGKAILARQDQGSMSTAKLFDNLRLGVQLDGEIALSLIEQFVTEQKEFRITGIHGRPSFITMNDGLPENDITRSKADFVISEADWRATMRQAANDQLVEMMNKMPPQVALVMLDLVVDSMDVENRDEIVKRIRALNGQSDPNQAEPTPEEQQAAAAKAQQDQMNQQAQQLQLDEQQAKVGKLQSEQQLLAAKAKHADAGAALVNAQTVAANMTGANLAMEAATLVIQMPTIAKVADGLLQQGGWSGPGAPTNLTAAPMAAAGVTPRPGFGAPQVAPAQATPPALPAPSAPMPAGPTAPPAGA
jgi:hypothetical protein